MPFRFPFMPYNYNNYNYSYGRHINHIPNIPNNSNYTNIHSSSAQNSSNSFGQNNNKFDEPKHEKKHPENEDSECFFELFGLRLHFDDVLIICILFFLYNEEVHDYELFLCLVLLLIS